MAKLKPEQPHIVKSGGTRPYSDCQHRARRKRPNASDDSCFLPL